LGASFDIHALNKFYDEISSENGVSVSLFKEKIEDLFGRHRSVDDLTTYRLHKSSWKKLSDEVVPVSRFLNSRKIDTGIIRFPLDDQPPDAWFWPNENAPRVGIEVTIALGRERQALARELVEKDIGRGFLGLQDDAPQSAFDEATSRQRFMYDSDQALTAVRKGIQRCLQKKNKPRYKGFILLIEANLHSLPFERWALIEEDLKDSASPLPFSEIWVIGSGDSRPRGIRIK